MEHQRNLDGSRVYKKVIPDSVVVLGTEVSYDSVSLLEENTEVDVIVKGKERSLPFLIERLMNNKPLDVRV